MTTVLSVAVGAFLTAIVGNFLVQRWQQRGWRDQQRQLGYQAELDELRRLAEDLSTKTNNRLNSMRRLSGSLSPSSAVRVEERLADYRVAVTDWMVSLNPFYVRLRLYLNYEMALRLEREIHKRFAESGNLIEEKVRIYTNGGEKTWNGLSEINTGLDQIQGSIWRFFRDFMDKIESRREQIYFGTKLPYSKSNIQKYSGFELIKALFISDVDGFYVVRTP